MRIKYQLIELTKLRLEKLMNSRIPNPPINILRVTNYSKDKRGYIFIDVVCGIKTKRCDFVLIMKKDVCLYLIRALENALEGKRFIKSSFKNSIKLNQCKEVK